MSLKEKRRNKNIIISQLLTMMKIPTGLDALQSEGNIAYTTLKPIMGTFLVNGLIVIVDGKSRHGYNVKKYLITDRGRNVLVFLDEFKEVFF